MTELVHRIGRGPTDGDHRREKLGLSLDAGGNDDVDLFVLIRKLDEKG
jgi:hypothetical protein